MIQIRPYETELYNEIARWWEEHRVFPVPATNLPLIGAVAYDSEDDKTLLAAAFLYLDIGVPLGLLAWPVVNPDVDAKLKGSAMGHCVEYLKEYAKTELNVQVMLTLSSIRSVTNLLSTHGFNVVDSDITALVGDLRCHH